MATPAELNMVRQLVDTLVDTPDCLGGLSALLAKTPKQLSPVFPSSSTGKLDTLREKFKSPGHDSRDDYRGKYYRELRTLRDLRADLRTSAPSDPFLADRLRENEYVSKHALRKGSFPASEAKRMTFVSNMGKVLGPFLDENRINGEKAEWEEIQNKLNDDAKKADENVEIFQVTPGLKPGKGEFEGSEGTDGTGDIAVNRPNPQRFQTFLTKCRMPDKWSGISDKVLGISLSGGGKVREKPTPMDEEAMAYFKQLRDAHSEHKVTYPNFYDRISMPITSVDNAPLASVQWKRVILSLLDELEEAGGEGTGRSQAICKRYRSTFLQFDGRPSNSGWVGGSAPRPSFFTIVHDGVS